MARTDAVSVSKARDPRGFVGRVGEVAVVLDCAQKAAAGLPCVVTIEGEAGIGKTALAREVVDRLDGFQVCWAACDASERDLHFGVVDQLVRRIDRPYLQDYPLLSGSPHGRASSVEVGAELIRLLGDLQTSHPLALVLDDAQWADDQSVKTLGFVMSRLWSERVLILLTERRGSKPEESADWKHRLSAVEHQRTLRLSGLADTEVAELARAMGSKGLSRPAVRRLRAHTGGHPLYLKAVLNDTPSEDLADLGQALPVPQSLAATVARTLGRLPESSRLLADALAVLNAPASPPMLTGMTGIEELAAPLDGLVEAGLVSWPRTDPDAPARFRHALHRESVYHSMSPARRTVLHERAARLMPPDAAWAHRVAAATGVDQDLSDELEAQARRQTEAGELRQAATYLLWAADLAAEPAGRERCLLRAAMDLYAVSDFRRLLPLYERIAACSPSAQRDWALALFVTTVDDTYRERYLRAAIAAAEAEQDTELVALASAHLGSLYVGKASPDEGMPLLRQALEPKTLTMVSDQRVRWMLAGAVGMVSGGHAAVEELAALVPLPEDPTEVGRAEHMALMARGAYRISALDVKGGIRDLDALASLRSHSASQPVIATQTLAHLALGQYLAGRWEDGSITAELALTQIQVEQHTGVFGPSYCAGSMIAAGQGRWEDATNYHARSRTYAAMATPGINAVYPVLAAAVLARAQGDFSRMLEALDPALASPWKGMFKLYEAWVVPLEIEALSGTGDLDAAEALLPELERLALTTPCLRMHLLWSRGRLAQERGNFGVAMAAYDRGTALPVVPGEDIPLHRALLEHARGSLLHRTGNKREAIDQLETARHSFTALGASPFAKRVADELAQYGQQPDEREEADDAFTSLTERERAVAHLAARGLTNKEVAKELYVSTKTVEYHLSHVFTKLNLTSRRQLRALAHR